MELYGAFGDVQFRGDFFVCEALEDAVENLLLAAAYFHSGTQGAPGCQQLLRSFRCSIQQGLSRNNEQFVIFRRLASHQAMNRQQPGNFFHRHAAIGIGLDSKTHCSSGTLAQDETLHEEG